MQSTMLRDMGSGAYIGHDLCPQAANSLVTPAEMIFSPIQEKFIVENLRRILLE